MAAPNLNRRNFLQLATMALAGKGLQRTWPFRVFSFPKEVKIFSAFDPKLHLVTTPNGIEPSWIKERFIQDPDCPPGRLYGIRTSDLDMYDIQATFMNIKRNAARQAVLQRAGMRRSHLIWSNPSTETRRRGEEPEILDTVTTRGTGQIGAVVEVLPRAVLIEVTDSEGVPTDFVLEKAGGQ